MRFRKNVPAEHREFLQEQLKQYKKEITMSKDELRELRELRGDYDTVSDSIIINTEWSDPVMDPDAELPFS